MGCGVDVNGRDFLAVIRLVSFDVSSLLVVGGSTSRNSYCFQSERWAERRRF